MVATTEGAPHQNTIAFFPLFPATVRAVHLLLPTVTAFTVLVLLFGAAASVAVWFYAYTVADRRTADRVTAIFCFFPGSIALTMWYSEGLMIALAATTLFLLYKQRWVAAGIAGYFATLTRPNAVAVAVAATVAAIIAIRSSRSMKALAAPLLSIGGTLSYFLFQWVRTGDPFAWFHVERYGWHERFDFGTATFREIQTAFRSPAHYPDDVLAVICIVAAIVCLVALRHMTLPPAAWAYTITLLLLTIGSHTLGLRPRFELTAFPLAFAAAGRLPDRHVTALVSVLAGFTALLMVLTLRTVWFTP